VKLDRIELDLFFTVFLIGLNYLSIKPLPFRKAQWLGIWEGYAGP